MNGHFFLGPQRCWIYNFHDKDYTFYRFATGIEKISGPITVRIRTGPKNPVEIDQKKKNRSPVFLF